MQTNDTFRQYILANKINIPKQQSKILDVICISNTRAAVLYNYQVLIIQLYDSRICTLKVGGQFMTPYKGHTFLIWKGNYVTLIDSESLQIKTIKIISDKIQSAKFLAVSEDIILKNSHEYLKLDGMNWDRISIKYNPCALLISTDEKQNLLMISENNNYQIVNIQTRKTKKIKLPLQFLQMNEKRNLGIYFIDIDDVIIGYCYKNIFTFSKVFLQSQKVIKLLQFKQVRFGRFVSISRQRYLICFSLCIIQSKIKNIYKFIVYNYKNDIIEWQHEMKFMNYNMVFDYRLQASKRISSTMQAYIELNEKKQCSQLMYYKRISKKSYYFYLYDKSFLRALYPDSLMRKLLMNVDL